MTGYFIVKKEVTKAEFEKYVYRITGRDKKQSENIKEKETAGNKKQG